MAISDPAWDYIESEKASLLDFIFRLSGDGSRAGIIATDVCEYVHRELMSSWSQREIRVELFAYAYESNIEVSREIEKTFFEQYYRNQFKDTKKIAIFYPLELFLLDLGPSASLVATLMHRYGFQPEEIARITDRDLEGVEADLLIIKKASKAHPKIKLDEAVNLPVYDFLNVPEHHPTDISHILGDMKPKKMSWQPRMIGILVFLGLVLGIVIYQTIRLIAD